MATQFRGPNPVMRFVGPFLIGLAVGVGVTINAMMSHKASTPCPAPTTVVSTR